MYDHGIPETFLNYAVGILADTHKGLSGAVIVKTTTEYAIEYEVDLPHPKYPFDVLNKRVALYENLKAFSPKQQYRIIKELCDHPSFSPIHSNERKKLKIQLVSRYSHLDPKDTTSEVNETLVEETRHWLEGYPDALSLYSQALEKYDHRAFQRNLLDDLRLSLEKLLRDIFHNSKSLENQISFVGTHIKSNGGSTELSNMFKKLLDYYAEYQNSYVKHDDAVIEEEIEFILEISSSFMKHLVRLSNKNS